MRTPAATELATPTPTASSAAVYLGRSSSRRSSARLAASVFAYLRQDKQQKPDAHHKTHESFQVVEPIHAKPSVALA